MSEAIEMVQELDSELGDIVWMLWRVECECVGPAARLAYELGGRPLALARGRARVSFHRTRESLNGSSEGIECGAEKRSWSKSVSLNGRRTRDWGRKDGMLSSDRLPPL